MYGMVNNAIRSFVIENYGADAWRSVCDQTGIDDSEFAAMLPYDDALSLAIVGCSADVTGMSTGELLHKIGRYWVHFAAESAFGPLIRFGGSNFRDFIGNLDAMHSKIQASLPKLAPPSFKVEAEPGDILVVYYSSTREGLFPFVEGLFVGLSDLFSQKVEILHFEALGPSQGRWKLRVAARGVQQPAA